MNQEDEHNPNNNFINPSVDDANISDIHTDLGTTHFTRR